MVNYFDIFAISEHSLFEEQSDIFDRCTDLSYKWTAVSSKGNPPILSGKPADGGVALFWKISIGDLVTTLDNIDSDRIVGIRCDFPDSDPLFILSDPNVRGLKLIEFANFFNLCSINLLANCSGPLETFVSHCGRYKSTLDYIFLPNCPSDKIVSCKTFENSIDNTSDHLLIKLQLNCYNISVTFSANNNLSNNAGKHKIKWGKISKNEIESCYTVPIDFEMSTSSMSDYNSLLDAPELIITFLMKHSAPFVKITKPRSKTRRKNYMKLPVYFKVARAEGISAFYSWKQSGFPTDDTHVAYLAMCREYRQKLRKFLNQSETDRIKDLCNAANSNENLFWKLTF